MRRAHTEITEGGECMENCKSQKEQQTAEAQKSPKQFSVPSSPSVISVWTRPSHLSPTPRPRKGQHFLSRAGVQHVSGLEPSLARNGRAKLEILEPLR